MDEGKHKIEINLTPSAIGSTVEIDGVRVPQVKSVRIGACVGNATTVTLELIAVSVKVTGEVAKVEKKTVDAALSLPQPWPKPVPPKNQGIGGKPGHLKFNGVYWECGLIPWCEHRNKFAAFLHRLLFPLWNKSECKH